MPAVCACIFSISLVLRCSNKLFARCKLKVQNVSAAHFNFILNCLVESYASAHLKRFVDKLKRTDKRLGNGSRTAPQLPAPTDDQPIPPGDEAAQDQMDVDAGEPVGDDV